VTCHVKQFAVALCAVAMSAPAALAAAQPAVAAATQRHARGVSHGACHAARTAPHRACRSRSAITRTHARAFSGRTPRPRPRRQAKPRPRGAQSEAQQRAAAMAAALATPCANTEALPEAGNIAAVREAVLCLINRERAQNAESPLRVSRRLEAAAEGHAGELVTEDYFAHVSPSGETPVERIRATGYIPGPEDGYVIGENLAWGTYGLATAQQIVSAWIASPGHLANILEAKYTETGIGIAAAVPASLGNGAPGATYAQEFGVVIA